MTNNIIINENITYKYNCLACDFHTNYNSLWERHIATQLHQTGKRKTRVDKKRLDKCPYCDYTSKINTILKQHILIKHSTKKQKQKEFPYYCKKCNYGSFAKPSYERHLLTNKHKQIAQAVANK